MKRLTKTQTAIMTIGALLMVAGIFMTVLAIGEMATYTLRSVAAIAFSVGATAFAVMQLLQTYNGSNITVRRLRNIIVVGNICLILSALLMLEQTFRVIMPMVANNIDGYNIYYHYVHNNWGVMLLIACILQLYATFRLSGELKKES